MFAKKRDPKGLGVFVIRDSKGKGQLNDVGDYGYVLQLNHAVPTTAGWEGYARIIHQCATKRLLANLGKSMAICSQGEEDAETQVEQAMEGLMEIATGTKEIGFEDALRWLTAPCRIFWSKKRREGII